MRWLRDFPIRRKITLLIMTISGIGLLLAGSLIILYEWDTGRKHVSEDLTTLAQVIGDQSTAALAFSTPKDASDNLATLAAKPEISAAAIYGTDGILFAAYRRDKSADIRPVLKSPSLGTRFVGGHLAIYQSIEQKGDRLGTIYLEGSLDHVRAQLVRCVQIVIVVIALLMLVTLLVSRIAQRALADPILSLAGVAQEVSKGGDYSLRAEPRDNDEIGLLTRVFNEMLGRIEASDGTLREMNASLQHEVAERQRAETSLAAHAGMLEQRNRELQEFAYVASHDLQEPLRAIQNFSERLRTKHAAALNEEANDYLQRMQNAAGRMRVLIQDLLTFSRVTTQAKPFEPTDLNAIMEGVIADLSGRLEDTGGRVELGQLPTIDADSTQMRQLLQNLIGNALKFHRENEAPVVKVSATDGAGSGEICLSVSDNGIGFDEKYCDRIFTPFQRLHNQRKYEGTGIGLAICRKIVERHEGSISVRSAPGEGATFLITLPVAQPTGGVSQ